MSTENEEQGWYEMLKALFPGVERMSMGRARAVRRLPLRASRGGRGGIRPAGAASEVARGVRDPDRGHGAAWQRSTRLRRRGRRFAERAPRPRGGRLTVLEAARTLEPARVNYAAPLRYEARMARGSDPYTCRTTCEHCGWAFEGNVTVGAREFKDHLRAEHPEVLDARKRRPKSATQREAEARSEALAAAVAD